jgi:nucleoside-diphosphate-sugar epimerase
LNVLEAARINGATRVIHTSTSECYGTAQYTPIDEGHPLRGQSPYAATKIGADKLAESFHLSFGLPVTTIRPFNTFGPRQSARAVIPTILSQLLSGREELRLGELTAIRDLNYVTNTVDGFLAAGSCDKAVGTLLNLGTGVGVTIKELALLAMKVVERNVPIVQDPKRIRPNDSEVFRLLCNFEKVKELTGWTPAIDLEDGLRKTAQYVEAHRNRYRPDEYKV